MVSGIWVDGEFYVYVFSVFGEMSGIWVDGDLYVYVFRVFGEVSGFWMDGEIHVFSACVVDEYILDGLGGLRAQCVWA